MMIKEKETRVIEGFPPWWKHLHADGRIQEGLTDLSQPLLEGDEGRRILDEFLDYHMLAFQKIEVRHLGHKTLHSLSKAVLSNSDDWKDLVSGLGCDDIGDINVIEYQSKCDRQLPFYRFLSSKQQLTLEKLVQVFRECGRYDLLKIIKEKAIEILEEMKSKESTLIQKHLEKKLNESSAMVNLENLHHDQVVLDGRSLACLAIESTREKATPLVLPSAPTYSSLDVSISLDSFISRKATDATSEDIISVFIAHSNEDTLVAEKLAVELRARFKFLVFFQSEEKALFATNAHITVYRIQEKVDFIIPLLSNKFLEQIEQTEDSENCSWDQQVMCYFFNSIQNYYFQKQCINKQVKPVVVEGTSKMTKMKVRNYSVFQYYDNLWDDLDRLGKLLRDTKKLN